MVPSDRCSQMLVYVQNLRCLKEGRKQDVRQTIDNIRFSSSLIYVADASLPLTAYSWLTFFNHKVSEKNIWPKRKREREWVWGHPSLEGRKEREKKDKGHLRRKTAMQPMWDHYTDAQGHLHSGRKFKGLRFPCLPILTTSTLFHTKQCSRRNWKITKKAFPQSSFLPQCNTQYIA